MLSFHTDFVAYQYFLHVVPTTYIAPRSSPLHTAQYSVTHYTREVSHDSGTPGIFFKFDLDPLAISIHQRTTSFLHLLIRCVGVLGGVFVCMSYAIRVTNRAVRVVTGSDQSSSIVAAESSSVRVGLRAKWGGGELRSRKVIPQGGGWTVEGNTAGSPYSSYAGTPLSATYSPSVGVGMLHSPYLASPNAGALSPYSPRPVSPNPDMVAPGLRSASSTSGPLGPPPRSTSVSSVRRSISTGVGVVSPLAPSNPIVPPSSLPTVTSFGSPQPPTLESENPIITNGNGQNALPPTTPRVGYARFPSSSPRPATPAVLPHTKGTEKED